MKKCPICGYDPSEKLNYIQEIRREYDKRSKKTAGYIKKVWHEIIKYTPSERNNLNLFRFMKGISNADDICVNRMIEEFLAKEYHTRQYGLSYLRSMILNDSTNLEKRKELERKRLGSLPPKRRIE